MKIKNEDKDKDFLALVGTEFLNESRLDRTRKIRSIIDFIVRYDLDINDIVVAYKRKTNQMSKYRDPLTGATWSGKGRQPKWFLKYINEGGKKEDLEI